MKPAVRVVIIVAVLAAAVAALVLKPKQARPIPARDAADAGAAAPAQPVESRLPRLVDLGADKCIPCKLMKPVLDELKRDYADQFSTEFIDVWKDPEAGKRHGVRAIPTQIFYDAEGQELFRHEGFYGKEEILGKWRELGLGASRPELTVFYFHGTVRCETCLSIESLARAVLETQFAAELSENRIVFCALNFDLQENRHYATQYGLSCPSLVLSRAGAGGTETWRLLGKTWDLVEDPTQLKGYVADEVRGFLALDRRDGPE